MKNKRKFIDIHCEAPQSPEFAPPETENGEAPSSIKKKPKKQKPIKFRPDKLLIVDLNKVLIARAPMSMNFRCRPYWLDFLKRMSKIWHLALWSSATKATMKKLTSQMFKDSKKDFCLSRFKFVWHQAMCTRDTETVVNEDPDDPGDATTKERREKYYGFEKKKPLFRKDLSKVIEQFPEFTGKVVLLDDSSKKGIFNHPKSMITPKAYKTYAKVDEKELEDTDTELCDGSELCLRLEALARSEGVLY